MHIPAIKCVHTCSKSKFQEAYLSEYWTKFDDLELVGKPRTSSF